MSEVFNLVNLKGGVGKTVSTINIAYAMNKEQKRVLIIDTDSQGNILTALGQNPNDCPKTLADLMLTAMERPVSSDEVKEYIINIRGVDIIPANYLLAGIDFKLMQTLAREYVLKGIIDRIEDSYDYILIDSPPSLGSVVLNSLTASDCVLIPVEAHYLSYESLKVMLDTISVIRLKLNPNIKTCIFLTKYQCNTNLCKAIMEKTKEMYADMADIFNQPIPFSVKAAEQTLYGKSLVELMPEHKVSLAYKTIAKELMIHG